MQNNECYLIQSNLLKRQNYYACTIDVFLETSNFFQAAVVHRRETALVFILLLKSNNLLRGYEQ